MFPKLQKKFIILYTLTTGAILSIILSAVFLFYISLQNTRREAFFQDHLFTLISHLQTEDRFSDAFLAQMEHKYQLLIYMEENGTPLFFPGSYKARTDREILFHNAEKIAAIEGIYPSSHPISSHLLQSSVFRMNGDSRDIYLGNVLILQTDSGHQRLIILQDIGGSRLQLLQTGIFFFLIDLIGILFLFLTGRWFVRRSLKPLEELYQKQSGFVAAASHELRSPLSVILTTASAITDISKEQQHYLQIIRNECRRESNLVKRLLLLTATEQKNWAVKKERFEIDDLLLELLELYEPIYHSKNGRLLLVLPDSALPQVYADPGLCRQILTILLDNAAAYALSNVSEQHLPEVILLTESSRSHIKISVIDHGPGIPDKEKQLIFDRFYRSDPSRSQKEHFGLGLSIAAALAEVQKISLSVQDTEGGGCTFSIKIPAIAH